jgi:hypothetical protein
MEKPMKPTLMLAAGAVALFAASAASAQILNYRANLRSPSPGDTHARGEVTALLDTNRRVLDYTVTYSGLGGPVVNAAFVEGATPAVVVPVSGVGSQVHAVVQLTDAQMADLNAGRWSFDLRDAGASPEELRGDVKRSDGY